MGTETTETTAPRIRAVVVDDSIDVCFLLATILEKDGRFEVVGEAHSADDGLALVTGTTPDLVLIDLALGGHDGTWLITRLRAAGSDAVLAVVTGSSVQQDHEAALDAGADSIHDKMSMTSTMSDDLAATVDRRVPAMVH